MKYKSFANKIAMVALVISVAAGVTPPSPVNAQTSCSTTTAPATTYGQVTQSVSVASAGTYRVWSRIKAPDTTNNSYYFQVDKGCATVVGDATSIPANTWTWVNYSAGNTGSFINVTLTAGAHTLTYTGKEPNLQLDRVLLLGDTACVPTGTGDNCANVDAINPTASITAPANGSSSAAGSTITINATAADNVGVAKVDFYIDGALKGTDTSSPYSYVWNTAGTAAGAHSLTVRATDAGNNTGTSNAVSVTLTGASTVDTTKPTVSLTAPTAGSTITTTSTASTVPVSATATDNVGISKVEFYDGTTLIGSDTSAPYSVNWSTATMTAGTRSITAKAYDAAGNSTVSAAVSVTVKASTTTTPPVSAVPGDANADGRVNGLDYSILASYDGQNYTPADFNKDGTVGAADLAILLAKWTW